MTATARIIPAPSMHQTDLELEESKSMLVPDSFTPVATQDPSGEEAMAARGAAAEPALLDPPQAPSPPRSFDPAAGLTSLTPPPQRQAEMERSGSSVAAPPPLDEPSASTTTLPVPDPYNSAASQPLHARAEATESSTNDKEIGLQQLTKVLTSLGYNEMASAATLFADSPSVAGWTGAITVFAAPDVFLQASCPSCSPRRLFLEHIALGYFPVSELAAVPTVKLPSASVGFCLNVTAEPGPFVLHHVNLYVDGIEISHPELYNDGRYVVHGLHGFVPPLSYSSCYEAEHHRHHLAAKLATGSAASAASVVRIMIRDAMSRLRDGGFGFVALAMRVKFAELEKFANLTVMALDDQAIFTGRGHDYVSSVRFHIVPGHRLTRTNLLQLRPGTKLPTLAGKYQKLVITHGAGSGSDEVRINYIPVKESDVVVNSRVAIHGIYVPFPRLHLASLSSSPTAASTIEMNSTCPSPPTTPSTRSAAHVGGERMAASGVDLRGRHDVTAKSAGTSAVRSAKSSTVAPPPTWAPSRGRHSRRSLSEAAGGNGGQGAAAATGAAGVVAIAICLNRQAEARKKSREKRKERWVKMSGRRAGKTDHDKRVCCMCNFNKRDWTTSMCQQNYCSLCVVDGFLNSHVRKYKTKDTQFCNCVECQLPPQVTAVFDEVHKKYFFTGEEKRQGHDKTEKKFVCMEGLQKRVPPKRLYVLHNLNRVRLQEKFRPPDKKPLPMD